MFGPDVPSMSDADMGGIVETRHMTLFTQGDCFHSQPLAQSIVLNFQRVQILVHKYLGHKLLYFQ